MTDANVPLRARTDALPADVVGLSEVARAALAAGPRFAPLPVALRPGDIPRPAERLGAEEREVLTGLLRAGYQDAGVAVRPEVDASLAALAHPGVSAVLTGQQPGFAAAPLYSLYKALQACRLAKELTRLHGERVVPIFWNHADDHDIAEVHHAWLLNRNLDLQKVGLSGLSSGRVPVGELALDAEAQALGAVAAQLRGVVEEHAGADAAVDLFTPKDGETLARAFTRALDVLAGRFGLIVSEPAWIRPLLSSELGRIVSGLGAGPALTDALRAGEEELGGLGLPAPIPVGDGGSDAAALVYRHVEGERVALRAGGEGLVQDGKDASWTHAELGSRIVGTQDEWSAGALVRPLVQDAVFPAVAYVGGWGELGYHAQLGPARDAAGLARTPFVPRVSVTIVDDETRYALTRVGSPGIAEVLGALGTWQPASDDSAEPTVVGALNALAERTRDALLEHRAALSELEPALAITLKKTAGHVEQSIGKVVAKALRVHDNRAGKGARQLRRVNNTLCPRGAPQERVLGPFQFVARYGGDRFVDALRAELPATATEHLVLHLVEEENQP
ncbi:MAG: bacillithiol biosynthesis BshC [Planctomycetota bacterium]